MSKILFVCFNEKQNSNDHIVKVRDICDAINPDNIKANPTTINYTSKVTVGISNPIISIEQKGVDVLFGKGFGNTENWEVVNAPKPDGNYAIFRSNELEVEIVSDILGTRSVWYYFDDSVFVASTSQRAIIQYLGSFKFNEAVIPWVLTNGFLGPDNSWDKRISLLPPDSSLILNRQEWHFSINTQEVEFKPNTKSDEENIKNLLKILETTFSDLGLDYSEWNLSLSGGYDSRGNFIFLPKKDKNGNLLETITWGQGESPKIAGSDAYIAKRLAEKYSVPHRYFHTDKSYESLEVVFERFLRNGEGRIDHIGGYTDGFKIWKTLFENNICGVIRGDEVFGSYDFISEFHLKKFVGLSLISEYKILKKFPYLQSLPQKFPDNYNRRLGETFPQWRDRLYQIYLVPIFLSPLADLKYPYLEQINPFLSRNIINQVREMPDNLRTDKKAFKEIIKSYGLNIGFASSSSTSPTKIFFKTKDVVELITKELTSPMAETIFPKNFLISVIENVQTGNDKVRFFQQAVSTVKKIIPKKLKRIFIKQTYSPEIDLNLIAFRVFLIIRMIRLLEDDAKKEVT